MAISFLNGISSSVDADDSLPSEVFSAVAHDAADQERTELAPGADDAIFVS